MVTRYLVTVEGAEMTETVDTPAEEEKKVEDPMQTDEKKPEEGMEFSWKFPRVFNWQRFEFF